MRRLRAPVAEMLRRCLAADEPCKCCGETWAHLREWLGHGDGDAPHAFFDNRPIGAAIAESLAYSNPGPDRAALARR